MSEMNSALTKDRELSETYCRLADVQVKFYDESIFEERKRYHRDLAYQFSAMAIKYSKSQDEEFRNRVRESVIPIMKGERFA